MARATGFVVFLGVALQLGVSLSHAQIVWDDGRPPAKGRSPELHMLDYMVGTWDTEAVARFTPDAKEFAAKMITVIEWSPNGQFLVSDEWALYPGFESPAGHVPQGWLNKLIVTTWNPVKKEYSLINILAAETYTLSMDKVGRGGTVHGETRDGDHVIETWTRFERVSDNEAKFHTDCSRDHGPKWVGSEGVSKKRPQ